MHNVHAKVFDIQDYNTPRTIKEISQREGSWSSININIPNIICFDTEYYLWVKNSIYPRSQIISRGTIDKAIIYYSVYGLGLYVPKLAQHYISFKPILDKYHNQDYSPIAEVSSTIPDFIN